MVVGFSTLMLLLLLLLMLLVLEIDAAGLFLIIVETR